MKLIERAINILVKPTADGEWVAIKGESPSVVDLFKNYAIILAAIPAVAGFIGNSVIGTSILGHTFRQPILNGIIYLVLSYIVSLGGAFLVALVMDALAPTFGAKKNLEDSLKVVVYSMTASWVGGIFAIIPLLSFLSALAGIYSLVILFFGMKAVKAPPADKMVGYYVVTLIIALVIYVALGFIVGLIALASASAPSASEALQMFNKG
ncbi:MAG: YIP1 family protein [Deltaproteobacteria bacterium]|nr:YIP1 family protein [Deltaproteobacteria bacterium]